ncbi:MAG TPA: hypothetical protein VFK88_03330 [Gallionella sp.]|nr:hypothetical protein [Gallionella sp.]
MQEKLITRKVILSLAGVVAAAAFAPEASALPAFARQVGRACNACHAQHFPVLNAYGRDFKASGYTLMGSQGKVKDEHLSIPNTLNAAVLLKIRYQKDNTAGTPNTQIAPTTPGNGQWQFGDEASLFFGGRVADNVGFLLEGNLANQVAAGNNVTAVAPVAGVCPAGTTATPPAPAVPTSCLGAAPANGVGGTGGLMAGLKVPFLFNVGDFKLGVVPFTTDALGVQYGYELSSGGVLRANRWSEHRRETSAVQYNAEQGPDAGAATGLSFVARNDLGFINITKWTPSFLPGGNGGGVPSTNFGNNYVRIAATPTVGDWSFVGGVGVMSGSGYANIAALQVLTKETFVDFQAQGMVGGKELSVYAQYATAPASTLVGVINAYNANPMTRRAFTIGADYSVIPHVLHIGAAYRNAKNGKLPVVGGAGDQDNAITLNAVYDLYQNVALVVNHSRYSGSAYNVPAPKKHLTTFMMEGSW